MSVVRRFAAILPSLCILLLCFGCEGRDEAHSYQEEPAATPAFLQTESESIASPASDPAEIEPDESAEEAVSTPHEEESGQPETELCLIIGDTPVSVEWADNDSVEALKELVSENPLEIPMSMYGGFEQVGSLGGSLPRSDEQTTTQAGDIVLYAGDSIVVFYGSNAWSYTRLGRIVDLSSGELTELLSNGDVVLTITMAEAQK